MLRGGTASAGAAALLLLTGCGGSSSNGAGACGAQDAAAIQKRIEATGAKTMVVKPPGSPNGEEGFTRVVVEKPPGFVALWVDAYCSPDAATNPNEPRGIGLVEVIGLHVYVGLPPANRQAAQSAFNRFVRISEAH